MDSKPLVTADLSMLSTPTDMPSDVYKYMIQNASSRQRSKLMETGKFFYPKEFVKIDYAEISQNEIKCYKKAKSGTLENVNAELRQSLWIAERFHFDESTDAMIRSLPKSAVWNLQYLSITSQVVSYENFKFLISSGGVEGIDMNGAAIQYSDNKKEVPLEKIFELLPNLICLTFKVNVPFFASLESANIHCPSGLGYIWMSQLDEKFDFKTFSTIMLNNQRANYCITFKNGISEVYAKEMEAIIIKIKKAWKNRSRLPIIKIC